MDGDGQRDYTLLALRYGFCPECRDDAMFWVGQAVEDGGMEEGTQAVCVECPCGRDESIS